MSAVEVRGEILQRRCRRHPTRSDRERSRIARSRVTVWDVVGGSSPRAGFTRGWHSAGRSLRDHPRSRGVYIFTESPAAFASGSSPLARGLLAVLFGDRHTIRIIPARAGFTPRIIRRFPRSADHPRSRGVYSRSLVCDWLSVGSSPLARGLLVVVAERGDAEGIIPARAGFTEERLHAADPPRDHPRSRGVYTRPSHGRMTRIGSSPLARGLLMKDIRPNLGLRIIPARAGFTRPR